MTALPTAPLEVTDSHRATLLDVLATAQKGVNDWTQSAQEWAAAGFPGDAERCMNAARASMRTVVECERALGFSAVTERSPK